MKWVRRVYRLPLFFAFYLYELVVANLRIALDVMTPGLNMKPGFIRVPLSAVTDTEVLVFANLVSMTPGTLTVDVSPDRKFIYVHALYLDDIEAVRHRLKSELERRVLGVLR